MARRPRTRKPKAQRPREKASTGPRIVVVPPELILQPASPEALAAAGATSPPQTPTEVQERFARHLDRVGLDDPALARKFSDLVSATEVKVGFHKGTVVYSKPLGALDIQLRAAETVAKLKGHFPAAGDREEGRRGGPVVAIEFVQRGPEGGGEHRVTALLDFQPQGGGNGR